MTLRVLVTMLNKLIKTTHSIYFVIINLQWHTFHVNLVKCTVKELH